MYENLSDKELLQILVAEKSGEGVTDELMMSFPTLPYLLVNSTEEELMLVKGIGRKRAEQLKACYEIAKRLYAAKQYQTHTIKAPVDIANLLMPEMRFLQKEQFRIIVLNTKNQVIEIRTVSEGSLSASIVHPREVFIWPIKRGGVAAILCCHNHPSGDPEPSKEDIDTTKRLLDAGNILGIKVLDHIIIGNGRYVSLKELGLI